MLPVIARLLILCKLLAAVASLDIGDGTTGLGRSITFAVGIRVTIGDGQYTRSWAK